MTNDELAEPAGEGQVPLDTVIKALGVAHTAAQRLPPHSHVIDFGGPIKAHGKLWIPFAYRQPRQGEHYMSAGGQILEWMIGSELGNENPRVILRPQESPPVAEENHFPGTGKMVNNEQASIDLSQSGSGEIQ